MCSTYELKAKPGDVQRRFGLKKPPADLANAGFRPTNAALVLDQPPGVADRRARALRWGLSVDWDAKPLINARAETLTQKKTFQPLLQWRCLIPATAYFEWRKEGRSRLKNRIVPVLGDAPYAAAPDTTTPSDTPPSDTTPSATTPDDAPLFAFAGLMTHDGHAEGDDEAATAPAFTIITCAPSPAIAHIHGRMPVILAPDQEAAWLDTARPFAEVAPMLTPYEGDLVAAEDIPANYQKDLFG